MHIKRMHDMVEKMTECTKSAVEQGDTMVGAYPIKDVVDMIKDLSEAEYYAKISVAMDEAEYGEDYDEHGRLYYRGQPRNSMGRYTSRKRGYEHMMPMHEESLYPPTHPYSRGYEPMYYTSSGQGSHGGQSGSSQQGRGSRYGFAYDEYMQKRDMHSKSSPEENSKRIELLNDFIEDLEDMAKDVVKGMSPEEKQVWKIKLNKLTSM